ncbi:MAG: VOC family protein [Myxococcota bacterium]
MLSHVSLGVTDIRRSQRFYDAVLEALGFQRTWTGDTGLGYGPDGEERLNLFQKDNDSVETGAGFHLAFVAPSQDSVDRFHAAAIRSGGTCNGPPGLRKHYGENDYAAFVIDPDGHRLEAVSQ